MQKFTQKYAIVCLLKDVIEGYEFAASDWPLHITLADTFSIDWDEDTLKNKLAEIANTLKPVTTKAIRDEYFGPDKNVHVVLFDKTDELASMHYHIVNSLKEGGMKFNEPQYSEEGFLPHATVQKHARVNISEEITLDNIALIDMFPNKDPNQREILKLVELQ